MSKLLERDVKKSRYRSYYARLAHKEDDQTKLYGRKDKVAFFLLDHDWHGHQKENRQICSSRFTPRPLVVVA